MKNFFAAAEYYYYSFFFFTKKGSVSLRQKALNEVSA